MNEAGIHHVILSFRGGGSAYDVLALAKRYPGRITPAIKIKGRHWPKGNEKFFKKVRKQLATQEFGAIGEALLYHAAKGSKAPEWTVLPDDKQAQFVLNIARKNGWPLIVHWESKSSPGKADWFKRLNTLFSTNRDVSFPLIHMAQLDVEEVAGLIEAHPNVYFMVSKSNPIKVSSSSQPWTDMFNGNVLKSTWRDLIVSHPDRFIMALDNTWPDDWGSHYTRQVALWRNLAG